MKLETGHHSEREKKRITLNRGFYWHFYGRVLGLGEGGGVYIDIGIYDSDRWNGRPIKSPA